jgi:peptidyl-prolyl cis-trans isomerase A (cyclophilin A)
MRFRIMLTALLLVSFAAEQTSAKTSGQAKPAGPKSTTKRTTTAKRAGHPTAVFNTTAGKLTCQLFPDKAPKTVANFVGLSNGTKDWKSPATGMSKHNVPLYNGTIFHRVIPNFMIQGGDPAGNGTGSPGYTFEDEFDPSLQFDRPGRLAMANSGPGTNGSQFFITEVPTPHLNNHHTIFGQCDAASVELVKKIARKPADPRDNRPYDPVKVTSITITGMDGAKPATKPPVKFLGPPVKKPGAK